MKGKRMRAKLARYIVLVSLFVAMLSFSACSKINEMKDTAENLKSDVEQEVADAKEGIEEIAQDIESDAVQLEDSEEVLVDDTQEATEESEVSEETPTVEWPTDIPAEVPQMTGLNITAVVPLGTEYTLMFESDDMEAVKSYIGELEKAGFVQTSMNENKFGIDYYGEKDTIKVFINFVTGSLSKMNVAF